MSISCDLDKDERVKWVEENKYWGMIDFFLYLNVFHHDIMFDVFMCACFQ